MIVQGLPHACGGVSIGFIITLSGMASSPRMWGCFRCKRFCSEGKTVFPTHVGVFLGCLVCVAGVARLPHACGGVSEEVLKKIKGIESSPRMWGCFPYFVIAPSIILVFPTHVGVFLQL